MRVGLMVLASTVLLLERPKTPSCSSISRWVSAKASSASCTPETLTATPSIA